MYIIEKSLHLLTLTDPQYIITINTFVLFSLPFPGLHVLSEVIINLITQPFCPL